MTFINLEGMSLIGPGSEWFWTAFSGIVVAVTFVAIWGQLRLQRSSAAIEQLNAIIHEWWSERLCRAKFNVLVAIEAGTPAADLPSRSVSTVGFFWQRVGFLVRGGHIDRQLVYANLGDQVQAWWELIFPGVPAHAASKDQNQWEDFAWLVGAAAALDATHGVSHKLDQESIRAVIPSMIAHFREAIELEEALRAVTVQLRPTPVAVTSVRPGHADRVSAGT